MTIIRANQVLAYSYNAETQKNISNLWEQGWVHLEACIKRVMRGCQYYKQFMKELKHTDLVRFVFCDVGWWGIPYESHCVEIRRLIVKAACKFEFKIRHKKPAFTKSKTKIA